MPAPTESALLYKHADVSTALTVKSGHGLYLALESGQQILDATSGAGVTAIGHGNARVKAAIAAQLDEIAYVHPGFYKTTVAERLADFLVESTEGKMARAVLVGSGSEAVEAAMKLARQYFLELSPPQPTRSHFIAREGSWHGCTLGALAVGDFKALGCVTAVPGYFEAVKAVCDRHGALLIFDEVICGMGRTGTMHAWEQEGVVPDIQAVGKGLASGYGVISALLVNDRVVSALKKGSGYFAHGQTYQTHALSCAAALEVQRIIREEKLLGNVRRMGKHMEALLKERLGGHPNVGDIRGRGLFWGIEFVADKATKEPLDPELQVAKRLHSRGLKKGYDISIFPATGAADGWRGDQIWLAPPYIVQKRDVEEIVSRLGRVVEDVFKELATSC